MKVFFFLNILPPYRIGLYNKINEKLKGKVKFFFDSHTEKNRKWNSFDESIKFEYEILNSPNIKLETRTSNNTKLFRTIYFPFRILKICFKEKPETIISLEMGLRTIFCIAYSKVFNNNILCLTIL